MLSRLNDDTTDKVMLILWRYWDRKLAFWDDGSDKSSFLFLDQQAIVQHCINIRLTYL
jgi:hypothetical protein